MSILKFPLDRPVTTIMLFVGIALLGLISWTKLPQELFPSLAYPQISIVTKYEGAGPEEAEKLISKIIEESAGTVKNIKRVSSISKEGMSIVICDFRWGTDMNFAALDVREKIDLIKERLPKDSREPVVLKFNPFQTEAMVVSVSYNRQETDPWKLVELRQFCKKKLKDELERTDGVAKVEIRGGEQKEILVEVDRGRILANQISLLDVIKVIRETNITYPAGLIKEDMYEYPVKTVGEFSTVESISDVLLTKEDREYTPPTKSVDMRRSPESKRTITYLRDIADIKESIKDTTGYSRYNRRSNVSLSIFPQSGSNLINISKLVHEKLEKLKDKIPTDVNVSVIYDQSEFIKSSLEHIYIDAVLGGLFSFLILFFFLRDVTASVIIVVALPLSILAALSMMYFAGISINTMSLGGLALGVGMVIDNSNVVLEAIFSYFQRNPGKTQREVILEATQKQVVPVVGSTLTLVAIFLPFIFVSGVAGQLFKEMALTISFSMLSSVLVALILVPRLAVKLNLNKYLESKAGEMKILKIFPSLLTSFLKMPRSVTWGWLGVYFLIGAILMLFIPKEFMPNMDEHRFVLNITLAPQTTLKTTDDLAKRIEATIMSSIPEVEDMVVSVGSSGEDAGSSIDSIGQNQARIIVRLKKDGRPTIGIVSKLSETIKSWNIQDLETEFIAKQGLFGSSVGSSSGLTLEVRGKDLEKMQERSEKIVGYLVKNPTFYGVKVIPSQLVPELKLNINRERASLFGLNVQDISATLLAAIKGYVPTRFKEKEDEYDIRVRLRLEDRNDLARIGELNIYSPWGKNVQISQISELKFVKSLPEIRRTEGQRTYLINTNVNGSLDKGVKEAEDIFDHVRKPKDDLTMQITGESLQLKESLNSAIFALVMGIVIVYMILASQFESLVLPIITMTTVPMGLIGAIYSLFFTMQSLNSVSMQGLIMLIGLVVNSGIILVDKYNVSRKEHPNMDLTELIIECTSERMRAVLMTTLTTVLGVLPTALAVGKNATSPMAIAIFGGEMFRLVLTLFFVPSAYILLMQKFGDEKVKK